MLDYHVMTPNQKEVPGLQAFLKDHGIESDVEVLAYIACNNGIRRGSSMGFTWNKMKEAYKESFGEDAKHYGAIMGSFSEVPEVIADRRRATTGRFGNEPFDMIVYKELQPTE